MMTPPSPRAAGPQATLDRALLELDDVARLRALRAGAFGSPAELLAAGVFVASSDTRADVERRRAQLKNR